MIRKCYEPNNYSTSLVTLIKKHNFSQPEFEKQFNESYTYLLDFLYNKTDEITIIRERMRMQLWRKKKCEQIYGFMIC